MISERGQLLNAVRRLRQGHTSIKLAVEPPNMTHVDEQHTRDPHAQSGKVRVAVIYAGAFVEPFVQGTWRTHREYLVRPYRAATFLYLANDNVRLHGEGEVPKQGKGFWAMRTRQYFGGRPNDAAARAKVCARAKELMQPWLTACKMGDKISGTRSQQQYTKVARAYTMLVAHEDTKASCCVHEPHPRPR